MGLRTVSDFWTMWDGLIPSSGCQLSQRRTQLIGGEDGFEDALQMTCSFMTPHHLLTLHQARFSFKSAGSKRVPPLSFSLHHAADSSARHVAHASHVAHAAHVSAIVAPRSHAALAPSLLLRRRSLVERKGLSLPVAL